MATRAPIALVDGTYLPITDTTLTTCPTGERYTITSAKVVNVSAASATFSIHRVESGGSLTDEKLLVKTKGVCEGESQEIPELIGTILEPSDYISAKASVASAITIQIFASRFIV